MRSRNGRGQPAKLLQRPFGELLWASPCTGCGFRTCPMRLQRRPPRANTGPPHSPGHAHVSGSPDPFVVPVDTPTLGWWFCRRVRSAPGSSCTQPGGERGRRARPDGASRHHRRCRARPSRKIRDPTHTPAGAWWLRLGPTVPPAGLLPQPGRALTLWTGRSATESCGRPRLPSAPGHSRGRHACA